MTLSASPWLFWALASAGFAAATAILAKVGVAGIDADMATLIRTLVVVVALVGLLAATGRLAAPNGLSARNWLFLVLSGLATGASWLCYFRALQSGPAAQVAPIDKLSVVLVAIFGVTFLGERLTLANWAGITLIGAGAILVAWK